jgi:Na+/proline symporter
MSLNYIDVSIFVVFLAINLVVGLMYGKRTANLREYAVGDKTFSTATLTATIVATGASGSSLFLNIENTYSSGLYYIIARLGLPLGILLTAQLAKRMGEFLNNVSVAEAMGDLYGKTVQIITAFSGILTEIGYLAMQFKVISKMLAMVFNLEGVGVTCLSAAIIIAYSTVGGVKAVTFTDVLQFFTFGTIIPILALTIWNHLQDPTQIIATLKHNPNFDISKLFSWSPKLRSSLSLWIYFVIPGVYSPEIFQRIAMARDIKQVKYSLTYSAGLFLLIFFFMAWIGILLLTDNPNLAPNQVVPFMVNHHTYVGLRGLLGVGIMALAMSTADSLLNVSSVLFANDIIKPLFKQINSSVLTARLFTLIMGTAALLLALYSTDLLSILLTSASLYMPIGTVPILLTVFGFRSTTRPVLLGIAAGFLTVILWSIYFENSSSIIPGMLANLVFLVGSHYLLGEKGGWGKSEATALIDEKKEPYLGWKRLTKAISNLNPITYLEKNLPQKEYFYPLLSFYLLTATYASLYNIPQAIEQEYLITYRIIQYSVLMITTSLMAFPIWPPLLKNKRFLTLLWPSVIFYALFFVGGILVIMSDFQAAQVLIFMLNLVIAALLVYWPLALGLAVSGFIAAMLLFQQVMQVDVLAGLSDAITFKISYGLLLFSSFLIALFRHKQAQAHLAMYNYQLIDTQQAMRKELVQALNHREELLQELNPEEVALFDSTTSAYIQQAIYRVKNYIRLEVTKMDLNQLLSEVESMLKIQGLQINLKIRKRTRQDIIQADIGRIKQLLVNSIVYLHKQNIDKELTISLEDTLLGHKIAHIKNYIRKLEAFKFAITTEKQLPPTQDVYMISPIQSQVPQNEAELSLTDNARIIDAHYGYADTRQSTTHIYVLPVNVREVRGKVMELLRDRTAADPEELKHPLAIELEKKLLKRLQDTEVDLQVIQKALTTIKKYHGGVRRKSGEPFFTHPITVALILMDYTKDQDAILASLLHDTVEDTPLSMIQVKAMFGETVAFLVGKVTNLEDRLRRLSLEDHENLQRLIDYEDPRAALVKLADRMHNMRTIQGHSLIDKQKGIANETLAFFVPLAKHLGLEAMAQELDQMSLAVLGKKNQGS